MILAAILLCLAPVAIDGDTVRCGFGLSPTRVRIWAALAPETGQLGAVEAKAALQRRVDGGIVCEPRGASYNRTVAICSNGAGVDVARALITIDKTVVEGCSFSRSRVWPLGYYGTCPAVVP